MANPRKINHTSLCLDTRKSVRFALEIINREMGAPCLIIDEHGRCLGIITDGDVRRFLLEGHSLDEQASSLAGAFHSVDARASTEQVAEHFRVNQIRHLPIIDEHQKLVGLWIDQINSELPELDHPVLVLAGGKGSRLSPLTLSRPKPLIQVGGVTLLDRALEKCMADGYRNFFLSVNYLKDQVINHLNGKTNSGRSIIFIEEEVPLGTAGPIGLLPSEAKGNLLVVNADVIHNVDLAKMMETHEESGASMTVAVRLHHTAIPFGVVDVDGTQIRRVREKPTLGVPVNAGIYILSEEVRNMVTPGTPLDMPDLMNQALDEGFRVESFLAHEYWLDVGTHESLAVAESEIDKWHLGDL